MNPGYWRKRHHSQRGAIGDTPEASSRSLPELMQQLDALEVRLHQLKAGIANLVQLQQLQADVPTTDVQRSAQEVAHLQETADNFELELASRVVSWQQLQEPFWQAVRFGGLGLLIGWCLAWFTYAR
ncbi:DUF2203 domain-containing protein [Nodosilinea sp. LEGE 07298]|uniref:DUF2203 domain-containing protein n=1 Tax=Nodosilinea sp. LEGE 07298 TaxID=2777970 RepID=UPI001880C4CC|nr:DUF2203 domain-containing protein [Nodosilinea sp. LEGE 07298]MBE9113812.1 DUF2203 domain-containing protein [Nodosilinea sp. LEGE 07298]